MRTEDPRFLTTGGVYTADVEDEQLAGACHVHFVRSAVAHARIRSIDLSAALKAPGVIAAFTGADLAGLPVQAPPMPEVINTQMGQPLDLDSNGYCANRWIQTSSSSGQIGLGAPTSWTTIHFSGTNFQNISWFKVGSCGNATEVDNITVSYSMPLTVTITSQPTNQLVVAGSNAQFSVTAIGSQPLVYQWLFNQTNLLSGATNATLILSNVSNNLAGYYSVVVTNVYGSATSVLATLTILKTTPTLTWTNPAAIPYGTALGSTQLNASANVPGTFAYNPASGAVLSAGTDTLSVVFTPTDTTNYNSATGSVSLDRK